MSRPNQGLSLPLSLRRDAWRAASLSNQLQFCPPKFSGFSTINLLFNAISVAADDSLKPSFTLKWWPSFHWASGYISTCRSILSALIYFVWLNKFKMPIKKLSRHTVEQYHGIIVLNYRTIKFNNGEPQALFSDRNMGVKFIPHLTRRPLLKFSQPDTKADETNKTQKKKEEPDTIKIAPRQCISWKTWGGVEEFCTNYHTGVTSESICIYGSFIYRKWTKCSDLNLTDFKLTINLNNFCSTVAFSGEQNLKRDYSLFLEKISEVSYFILFAAKKRLLYTNL